MKIVIELEAHGGPDDERALRNSCKTWGRIWILPLKTSMARSYLLS